MGRLLVTVLAAAGAPREGHLHYQVDDGPVIATTATTLRLQALGPGSHAIRVVLIGNDDHRPLGAEQTLELSVP